jgi:mRNA export factor
MASCDKQVKVWDLATNQTLQVAEHAAPVRSIRWVKTPNYTALMTGSWDKTLKFWDTRSPNPIMSIDTGERVYCADVDYPMAVVGTAGRGIIIYTLEGQPKEFKRIEPPLKYQHRCIAIFKDKKAQPTGKSFPTLCFFCSFYNLNVASRFRTG